MLGLFLVLITVGIVCDAINPGPLVIATKGEVWPKPQLQQKSQNYLVLRPHTFGFKLPDNIDCPDFLDDAISRYWNIIVKTNSLERRGRLSEVGIRARKKFWQFDNNFVGYLDRLSITLNGKCAGENVLPELGSIENYTLSIEAKESILTAPSIWGILRGLETFSQLIYLEQDVLIVNVTEIVDFPRFIHRGLLLDTSRHFIPIYSILQTLDAMAFNKFNVFHWHLTDDQSFPYKSIKFPGLSEKGAYHPVSKVYQHDDIKKVLEYARLRGIRVIPEFDTPGHTRSWGEAYPKLLTQCYENKQLSDELGPMDPTQINTFQFLGDFFEEIVEVFPDQYVHIGGDEVDFTCWKSNPKIRDFMKKNNITTFQKLQSYFTQSVIDILDNLNANYIVWEEVFANAADLPNSTIVQVWKGNGTSVMDSVTKAGKYALFSSCWYLDHLMEGGDWFKFYECEVLNFPGSEEQKKLVLGGEACMWSESVNQYNLIPRVWPRASAVSEKLWSAEDQNVEDAMARLEEHTCRMNNRGIQAQPPNGPGVCL